MRRRVHYRFQSYGIPEELTRRRQWAGWKEGFLHSFELARPMHCGIAHPVRRETWATFSDALSRRREWEMDGLSFMLGQDDPFLFVSLFDAAHRGKPTRTTRQIIRACNTYAEISPDGCGVTLLFAIDPALQPNLGHPVPHDAFPDDCPLHRHESFLFTWPWGFPVPVSGWFISPFNKIRQIALDPDRLTGVRSFAMRGWQKYRRAQEHAL
jgi:hypothetical protein